MTIKNTAKCMKKDRVFPSDEKNYFLPRFEFYSKRVIQKVNRKFSPKRLNVVIKLINFNLNQLD